MRTPDGHESEIDDFTGAQGADSGEAHEETLGIHDELLDPETDDVPDYAMDGVVDGDVAVPAIADGDVDGDGVVDVDDLGEPESPFVFESRDFQPGGLFDRP